MNPKPTSTDKLIQLAIEAILPEHQLLSSNSTNEKLYIFEYSGFIDQVLTDKIQTQINLHTSSVKVKKFDYLSGKTKIYFDITHTLDINTSIEKLQHQAMKDRKNPDFHQIYLSKKGKFNELAKLITQIEPNKRSEAGKLLNQLKITLESLSPSSLPISVPRKTKNSPKKSQKPKSIEMTSADWFDPTIPGTLPLLGHLHPITQAIEEISQIFESIGFTRSSYPEVDWDKYVFTNLNMPANHPARDEWETFFIDAPKHPKLGQMVLTTHTSNGQTREMERIKIPPIRMLNIGKCYRRQQDVTHTAMFHQFEGLVVDEGINIQHLKGVLDFFAKKFYGEKAKSRIRPFHFQFTEPSFEVDFSCVHCQGKGCRFCKSGWHEVGGAGMVHPNVLKAGGIDPQKYTGFAFGWGVERVYTLKPGLSLDDIRPLYSNNLNFLANF